MRTKRRFGLHSTAASVQEIRDRTFAIRPSNCVSSARDRTGRSCLSTRIMLRASGATVSSSKPCSRLPAGASLMRCCSGPWTGLAVKAPCQRCNTSSDLSRMALPTGHSLRVGSTPWGLSRMWFSRCWRHSRSRSESVCPSVSRLVSPVLGRKVASAVVPGLWLAARRFANSRIKASVGFKSRRSLDAAG